MQLRKKPPKADKQKYDIMYAPERQKYATENNSRTNEIQTAKTTEPNQNGKGPLILFFAEFWKVDQLVPEKVFQDVRVSREFGDLWNLYDQRDRIVENCKWNWEGRLVSWKYLCQSL